MALLYFSWTIQRRLVFWGERRREAPLGIWTRWEFTHQLAVKRLQLGGDNPESRSLAACPTDKAIEIAPCSLKWSEAAVGCCSLSGRRREMRSPSPRPLPPHPLPGEELRSFDVLPLM